MNDGYFFLVCELIGWLVVWLVGLVGVVVEKGFCRRICFVVGVVVEV